MDKKTLIRALSALNIHERDAAIYLELLRGGPTNAGPIVRRSGMHRQIVYSCFERLEEQGLCIISVRNGRKVFQAAPPSQLLELQRRRETAAAELIPHLERIQASSIDSLEVTTSRGIPEFQKNLIQTLEEAATGDRILRVIGGGESAVFYKTLGNYYDEYLSVGQRLGVTKRLIASHAHAALFLERFAQEPNTELRFAEALSSPMYTRITPTLVTIEVYSVDPIIIQIRNRGVALSYRENFDALWERCQKVEPS